MTTAVKAGTPTGKTKKLYYNTGTRASAVWVLVTQLSECKWERGKPNLIQTSDRELTRKIQQQDVADPCKFTAKRRITRGAVDSVMTALNATSGFAGTEIEFAVAEDDITHTGCKYDRFFGKAALTGDDEGNSKFVEWDLEIDEEEHYESTALCPLMIDQVIA